MKTVITAENLVTPAEWIDAPIVIVEDGRIVAVESRSAIEIPGGARQIDFAGLALAPGFIDIHVHGGAGHDVMTAGGAALSAFERHMAKHGVTSYLPTTITAPQERILKALENLAQAIAQPNDRNGAVPLGIHLEGPFISHANPAVHPPDKLVPPSPDKLDIFWQASRGTIRMMTAPEIPGAIETIRRGRSLGVHSSLGHSDPTFAHPPAPIAAASAHATHA